LALIPQTLGRSFFAFVTLPLSKDGHPQTFICLLMFCIVESFRYSFYFLKQMGLEDSKIGRLFGLIRYNSFLLCYPIGAFSECLALFYTARHMSKEFPDKYSIRMPNRFNFAFDMNLFMYVMIPLYGVVFPRIYAYLLKQRKAYMQSLREKRQPQNAAAPEGKKND